jgi:hypothetical protein
MRKIIVLVLVLSAALLLANISQAAEKVVYSFESDTQGFELPDWTLEQDDMVCDSIEASSDYASEGQQSLKYNVAFPGGIWTAAFSECMEDFDWTPYSKISVDVYIPSDAPEGMKAEIVLTVGDNWEWKEFRKKQSLWPGKWTTLTADLKPGSVDWKRTEVTDEFRADVRKVGVRIISNKKPKYTGPIYIDNIRVE